MFSGGTSVQENNGTSSPTLAVEYVRGSDYGGGVGGILYTLRSGTPSYTHENRRGDVVAKTNASGSLTYQAQYEGFGNQVATSGSTLDRQKSNSKDTDPTGLVNEGFRYRDLETGGFITRDPAGFVDGPNEYTYVIDNPWGHFDPEGLYDTFVDQAERGAQVLTHQSLGQTASDLGLTTAANQAATGASRLFHGDTQAMGASLQQTGANIKTTAVQDAHDVGVGAQRLASGQVSGTELLDDTARGTMNAILLVGPTKGLGAIGAETKVVTTEEKIAQAVDTNAAKGMSVPEQTTQVSMAESSAATDTQAPDLKRPYIRKDVRAAVEASAPKTPDGKFIDPNTLQPIEGSYDLGHKPGNEFRTEKAKAQAEGLTQKQFNDRMNNPELYQIEDPSSNRSHKYEKKDNES